MRPKKTLGVVFGIFLKVSLFVQIGVTTFNNKEVVTCLFNLIMSDTEIFMSLRTRWRFANVTYQVYDRML